MSKERNNSPSHKPYLSENINRMISSNGISSKSTKLKRGSQMLSSWLRSSISGNFESSSNHWYPSSPSKHLCLSLRRPDYVIQSLNNGSARRMNCDSSIGDKFLLKSVVSSIFSLSMSQMSASRNTSINKREIRESQSLYHIIVWESKVQHVQYFMFLMRSWGSGGIVLVIFWIVRCV